MQVIFNLWVNLLEQYRNIIKHSDNNIVFNTFSATGITNVTQYFVLVTCKKLNHRLQQQIDYFILYSNYLLTKILTWMPIPWGDSPIVLEYRTPTSTYEFDWFPTEQRIWPACIYEHGASKCVLPVCQR